MFELIIFPGEHPYHVRYFQNRFSNFDESNPYQIMTPVNTQVLVNSITSKKFKIENIIFFCFK